MNPLEIPAAIKVLHVRLEPDTHEHFLHEARIIAHLQHAHIVRVLDFGFQDQTPFLVMEYSPNGTLRTRHPKGTRLPLEQIVSYVKQLAPALDYAHQQGVIHRDIKPENLLLNATDEVVLTDFGLAVVQRSLDSLSTQNPAGTPLHMAPEQIRGKPCAASDQYALAVVVYEWLCGEPPFRGSLFEVFSQHLSQPPPSLRARLPDLAPAVEEVVLAALAKEPHQRFASVQDFAEGLEEASCATQPLSSRLPTGQGPRAQGAPPPVTLAAPLPAPAAGASDPTAGATQPLLKAPEGTGSEHEPMPLLTPRPAAHSHPAPKHGKPSVAQTNRERLLRKVRAFWITGVLEHSLHGAALIALGLREQPEALANPWQLVLHQPAGAPHPLPAGTRITQLYDAAEGELLILGAPGSGKTTLLLELARELLARAEHEEQHPLPVVFNLSSWASKQQPLADWLVEELNRTYQVPRPQGQAWVEADQILPLLDGLDEVSPKERTRCIETINTYRQEHGLLPLVVCSRSADYLAQSARVRLGSAVAVQPLTEQQVDDYLASAGEQVAAVRVALRDDPVLQQLATTPLMLNILILAYQGVPLEGRVEGGSAEARQEQIFASYVQHMLKRRSAEMRYTPEQTTRWLSSLAGQMKRQSQTIFYIERMQADWLSDPQSARLYRRIALGLLGVLMSGLIGGLIFGLGSGLRDVLTGGVLGALLGGVIGRRKGVGSSAEGNVQPWKSGSRRFVTIESVKDGLVGALVFGLVGALIFGPIDRYVGNIGNLPGIALIYGFPYGLFGALIGVFIGLLMRRRKEEIQPAEVVIWSWRNMWRSFVKENYPMAEAKVFALTGDGAQISCSARGPFSDQPGLQPTFTYQDQELNLTFSAGQIRRKRT